jgi:phosphoribosylglycinamide formyltransferase 2
MVTLAGTQNLSEFELHARAVLGLPIPEITLERAGASAVILAQSEGNHPQFTGIAEALREPLADVRIFGKPSTRPYRRMAVALAYDKIGSDIQALVEKAKAIAGKVNVS